MHLRAVVRNVTHLILKAKQQRCLKTVGTLVPVGVLGQPGSEPRGGEKELAHASPGSTLFPPNPPRARVTLLSPLGCGGGVPRKMGEGACPN